MTQNIFRITEDNPLYEKALDLRYSVFFEPYGLPRNVTADEMESESIHVAIVEHDDLIAYGRLSPLGNDEYRISQIVVDPSHRGIGLSITLLELLIGEAKNLRGKRVRLGAQLTAQEFYKKFGFEVVSEPYQVELTGVTHVKMKLEIDT